MFPVSKRKHHLLRFCMVFLFKMHAAVIRLGPTLRNSGGAQSTPLARGREHAGTPCSAAVLAWPICLMSSVGGTMLSAL